MVGAPALKTAAANLTKLTRNNDGVFPGLAVLETLRRGSGSHGSADMPVWGDVFRQSQYGETQIILRTHNIVTYLESIQEPAPPPPAKERSTAPLRITDIRSSFGGEMYRAYCASCNGVDGRGGGPAAGTLKSTPADLTRLRDADGKFPTEKVQTLLFQPSSGVHGSTEMPVWGDLFRRTNEDLTQARLRVYNLTRHLESMQR